MSGGMRMIGQVLGWSTGVAMLRALIEPERGHWAAVVIFLIAGFVWVTTVPTKPG